MSKKKTWFHAAQVVRRDTNGAVCEWYDGEKRPTYTAAKQDRTALAEEFPGTEYTVLCVTVEEVGGAAVARPVAQKQSREAATEVPASNKRWERQ